MTREENIKALYKDTYEDEDTTEISIEEMESNLVEYYSAAGFTSKSIDELLLNHEESPEFIKEIEAKIEEALSKSL
ncbi:MAG: hypothetical protein ACRDA5_03565 [Clostridium sp.]